MALSHHEVLLADWIDAGSTITGSHKDALFLLNRARVSGGLWLVRTSPAVPTLCAAALRTAPVLGLRRLSGVESIEEGCVVHIYPLIGERAADDGQHRAGVDQDLSTVEQVPAGRGLVHDHAIGLLPHVDQIVVQRPHAAQHLGHRDRDVLATSDGRAVPEGQRHLIRVVGRITKRVITLHRSVVLDEEFAGCLVLTHDRDSFTGGHVAKRFASTGCSYLTGPATPYRSSGISSRAPNPQTGSTTQNYTYLRSGND